MSGAELSVCIFKNTPNALLAIDDFFDAFLFL
jgi:hypothetical protein